MNFFFSNGRQRKRSSTPIADMVVVGVGVVVAAVYPLIIVHLKATRKASRARARTRARTMVPRVLMRNENKHNITGVV